MSDDPTSPAPLQPPDAEPASVPQPGRLPNLRNGFFLALLFRRVPEDFVRSFDRLLALLLLNLLVWLGLEWWQHADADRVLGLDTFYRLGCYVMIALAGSALVARMNSRAADIRALLTPLLAATPWVQILFRTVPVLLGRNEVLTLIAVVLGMLYLIGLCLRGLTAAYGRIRLGAGLTAAVLVVVTPVALDAMKLETRQWVANDTSDAGADDGTVEPLLYSQPERLASALERIDTQPRHGGAVYFVGFAGDGDQGIFRREALAAGRAIGSHFGEQDRALYLINDDEDRETYPIASSTGLALALKLLAAKIDRANDVVVVTLTSHGSTEGLDVENGTVPLLTLEPDDLRQALEDSGIKWRVVIISACYSGVFVDSLKSDTTLVMTAADGAHSSFGCDDNRELTWFGETFFKEALPGSDTLEQAFSRAVAAIQERETHQGLKHSNPQLFVGAQMRTKLAAVEAEAQARAATAHDGHGPAAGGAVRH